MKFLQSKKFNKEYCARIVHITSFEKHPNPKCTRMKCALVGGFSISTSLDTEPGWFIYFPVGSQIEGTYLSAMNLFRKAQLNHDSSKTGFFEDNRKVKPIKLQGYPSEGFLIPVSSLIDWYNIQGWEGAELNNIEELNNFDFDSVDDHILVKRYFVKARRIEGVPKVKGRDGSKKNSKLVEGQFHFHYDSDSLERMPWVIKPWNLLHISTKFHGTSGISANILCKEMPKLQIQYKDKQGHKLGSKRKLLKQAKRKLFNARPKLIYSDIFASRKVIKNDTNVTGGYYGNDEFRLKAHEVLKPYLDKGITLYYELVGFMTTGSAIQSIGGVPMDYGCVPPTEGEPYTYGKHYDILIYRITFTNPDGVIHEFSAHEVQLWCKQRGLHAVKELYWGFAKDLYPDLDIHADDWATQFCHRVKTDQGRFYMELDSPDCQNEVPHEGVVIRIDDGKQAAYKVKSFRFLHKEDADYEKGIINIEDAELTSEDA